MWSWLRGLDPWEKQYQNIFQSRLDVHTIPRSRETSASLNLAFIKFGARWRRPSPCFSGLEGRNLNIHTQREPLLSPSGEAQSKGECLMSGRLRPHAVCPRYMSDGPITFRRLPTLNSATTLKRSTPTSLPPYLLISFL